MKIIFFGTPEFALASLDILVKNKLNIIAVVTAPDKPAGRGRRMQSPPVKDYALSKGLHVLQPSNLKDPDFIGELASLKPDLQIVVAFRMLPAVVWKNAPLGTFNLHASLLPQYRGAAPINRAIMNGEEETGLTTFFINEEIDTGKIIYTEKIRILPDENAGELHDRMMVSGAELLLKTTLAIREGGIRANEQVMPPGIAGALKSAPKISKEDCQIRWTGDIHSIYNFIRGLSPYPGAHSWMIPPEGGPVMIKIFASQMERSPFFSNPGEIDTDGQTYLKVSVKGGFINIRELQAEGRKKLPVELFLRGFSMNHHWKFA